MTSRDRARGHLKHGYLCTCGRYVHGNGGMAAHRAMHARRDDGHRAMSTDQATAYRLAGIQPGVAPAFEERPRCREQVPVDPLEPTPDAAWRFGPPPVPPQVRATCARVAGHPGRCEPCAVEGAARRTVLVAFPVAPLVNTPSPAPEYGPYQVGDFVEEGTSFYGIVVGAGPQRFRVQWQNTTRNDYRQDYQGIRRARFHLWEDDDHVERFKAGLRAEVRRWSER